MRSPYLVNKAFRVFAVSTILAVMATSLGTIINGVIVGNLLGEEELSAVNLVSPIIQLYNALNALVCVGGATYCALLVGKGNNGDVGKVFTVSMALMLAVTAVMMLAGFLSTGAVASLLCSSDDLLPLVEDYLSITLLGASAYLFLPGIAMFVRVDGSPNSATVALATANILSPILCVALIEAGYGISGAAMSMVVGYLVGVAVLIAHLVRGRGSSLLRLTGGGIRHAPGLLMIGSPVALASVLMMVKMLSMNHLTLDYLGDGGMVIMAVAMNILMLSSMIIGGTCQTIQPIGGTLYGSGDQDGISFLTRMVAKVLLVSLTALMVLVILFPGAFCTLFGLDPESTEGASTALRLFAPCVLLYGINYSVMILFQVLGHKALSVAVSVVQPLSVMALAFVLTPLDGDLLWVSFWIGELVVLVAIVVVSAVMRRRDDTLRGLLLSRDPEIPTTTLSVRGDLSDLGESLEAISGFLESNGVPRERSDRAVLCCEELLINVSQHGLSGSSGRSIDVIVRAGEEPSMLIRDDGRMFNPIEYSENGIGLQIARGMCREMTYSRAMGQNNVRFTF